VSVAKQGKQTRKAPEAPARPASAVLWLACALALVSGGWALHLWRQLFVARAGGEVTCPFDSEGDCGDVWQSGFAQVVESATGLPVAAHGLVWALVAFALPAAVWVARRAGRRGEISWAGALVTAAVGVAAVLGLAAAQLVDGRFCGSCAVAYAGTLAYAGLCFFSMVPLPWDRLARGGALAAAAAVLAWGTLVAAAPEQAAPSAVAPSRAASLSHAHAPAALPALDPSLPPADGLARLVADLSPAGAEALAQGLREYAAGEPRPLSAPRALVGSPMAPVRITDFADFLCSHCAALHGTLAQLQTLAPQGSFTVEPRYFPLDGQCNRNIPRASAEGVGCTAARVLICLEESPGAFELAGQIYARQRGLTNDQIYGLAAPIRSRQALEACVASPETDAKLQSDIAAAMGHGIQGTPLVLVNGRKASPNPALLLALVLAGGDPAHPAFAALPKAQGG
jgi:serine/threonine-protein kinase